MMKMVGVVLAVAASASSVCQSTVGGRRSQQCQGAANMCDCAGFPAEAFEPSMMIFAASGSRVLDGYAEGTCGYANAACDLKWTVLCCEGDELTPPDEASDYQPVEAATEGAATLETSEDYCARNGFPGAVVDDLERSAFVGGTCGDVLGASLSAYAECCCGDAAYCCPDGAKCATPARMLSTDSASYSYSYMDVGDVTCPSTYNLDLSVCYEDGIADDDCCAMASSASCATGFMIDTSDPVVCDEDGSVYTCCYNDCSDSTTWHKNGDTTKDCAWVADFAEARCDAKGADRSLASYSCPEACSTTCTDSSSWYKTDEPSKNCAWVSAFAAARCDAKGHDGTLASYACPDACEAELNYVDSASWYKTGATDKDCAWVSAFASARCDTKGWDGAMASSACLRACESQNALLDSA